MGIISYVKQIYLNVWTTQHSNYRRVKMFKKKATLMLLVATMLVGGAGLTGCGTSETKSNAAGTESTKKDEVKITLYDTDGKTVLDTVKVKSGKKAEIKTPEKKDYTFVDWYLNKDHTRKADLTKPFTQDTKLFAGFAKYKEDTRTFYIVGKGESPVLSESNWGAVTGDSQKLTKTDKEGVNEYTITLDLKKGDQFQFAMDGKWSDQRGFGYLKSISLNGEDYFKNSGSLGDASSKKSNIEVAKDGKYTFTLTTYPAEDTYDEKDPYYKEENKENFNLNPYDTISFTYSEN